jgi:peptidyl-prolyl cis-trans isomerase C
MTIRVDALRCSLIAGFIFACMLPAAAATVLAKVDGAPITDDDVATAIADMGPTLPEQLDDAQRQAYVLSYLIDLKLLAKKAASVELDKDPDFARQMAYYRDKVLMQTLLDKVGKDASTDAAAKKVYDDAAAAHQPEPEIHARHILVASEAEAKAALARVKAGEDFGKVADELSKDPNAKGGDLGWFTKDKMVPEFADAAFKLKAGEISDPVKTPFGWHIIQVEEIRQSQFPPFDQVKDQVVHYVEQKAQGDFVTNLRNQAKIERTDAAPAAPALAPTPGQPAAGRP